MRDAWHFATLAPTLRQRAVSAGGSFPTPPTTSRRISHEQGFAYYTAPSPAHSRRAARALKLLPIAALLAAGAAQAQVTSIDIGAPVQIPGSSACGDIEFPLEFLGSGNACFTLTVKQGALEGATALFPPDPSFSLPSPPGFALELGAPPLSGDITTGVPEMIDGPFTLTISAGTTVTCDDVVKTVEISDCSDPKIVAPTPTPTPTPDPAPTPDPDPTPTPNPTPAPYHDDSSPTLGELGLLLSGLALAGAAAPALRRREKRSKKG